VRLEEIYERFRDAVDFYVVYIREAHPTDEWQTVSNVLEDVVFAQPTTYDERVEAAHACTLGMDISIPTLIDGMSNEVGDAYAAMPDRLYLVDADVKIAFRSGPGPFGFKSDEFEEAIAQLVQEQPAV
jgi:Iodothyronine deiodinase